MRTLGIYYEHPRWFEPLFAELDRRGLPYRKLDARPHFFAPERIVDPDIAVVFNRMSPSAYNRGAGDAILYTLQWLGGLEQAGVRVVNGARAFSIEVSKALQLALLERLGLPYPKARVIHRPQDALAACEGLRWPIVVKPNVGGSGAGIVRFDDRPALAAALAAGRISLGIDQTGLVQEFIPARGGHIVRVEVLGGKFLYAIQVFLEGRTFDLCPADLCQTPAAAAPAEAPGTCPAGPSIQARGYTPPREVIEAVERMTAECGIEVGGVEYVIDERDGRLYYYDINALSNFVARAPEVVGFDPFERLGAWLESLVS